MGKYAYIVIITVTVLLFSFIVLFSIWNNNKRNHPVIIKIGTLLPSTTGDLVLNREQMVNGIEFAKEDIEKENHGNVILDISYDNGCFSSESIPTVQKYIDNKVAIIGASFCLFGHIPILPMTEGNKIITFNTAANPDVTLNLRYAFSTNVEVKDEAIKLSEFAYNKLGARRAVTMFLDTPFGHDYDKYFTRDFSSHGGQVVGSFPNPPDGKKFDEMITKIKALKPDVIVTAHFGVPLAIFIRDIRAANITAPILGNYETEDPTVVKVAGNAAEGVMFSSSELVEKTPIMKAFESRYIRRFGIEPGILATNSYDVIKLSVQYYLDCEGNRDCIAEKLRYTKDYRGVSGTITMNPSGATYKPTIFKVIRNRTFIPYNE